MIKKKKTLREPVSSLTHMIAAALAFAGTVYMLVTATNLRSIIGALIFGVSMVILYIASTIYHGIHGSNKTIQALRRFDHAAIFVLIAGTYTPICLMSLKGPIGKWLLIAIWVLAAAGIIPKMFLMNMPKWVSSVIYLGMGWISVFFISPLKFALPTTALVLLIGGGVLYSIGAIVYTKKAPAKKNWSFGYHEVFHLFVMLGTAAHFLMISHYVIN